MSLIRVSTFAAAGLCVFLLASNGQAQVIAGAVRGGSSTNDPPEVVPGGLVEDALSFVDRVHEYNDLPSILVGADYVKVANNDKTVADYTLEMTMAQDARLYLLIDNRVGDNDNTNPPTLGGGVMDWVLAMGFTDTGLDLGVDEGADGDIDQTASVFAKIVSGGSVVLLQQNDGGSRNMYGVAATAFSVDPQPVPALSGYGVALLSCLLLGGGLFALRRLRVARA